MHPKTAMTRHFPAAAWIALPVAVGVGALIEHLQGEVIPFFYLLPAAGAIAAAGAVAAAWRRRWVVLGLDLLAVAFAVYGVTALALYPGG